MHRTTLDLELVTPCFCGGSDPAASAEWRAQSVRGQLRWWFRAVAGPVVGDDVEKLKELEASIFGDTGQSSAVRIATLGQPRIWSPTDRRSIGRDLSAEELANLWWREGHGETKEDTLARLRVFNPRNRNEVVSSNPLHYLGYGCITHNGLERPCLAPGQSLELRIAEAPTARSSANPEAWSRFALALRAWLLLGGLGSRSRNGWGSLSVHGGMKQGEANGKESPAQAEGSSPSEVPVHRPAGIDGRDLSFQLREELVAAFGDLLRPFASHGRSAGDLGWTQLSHHSRIYVGREPHFDWNAALVYAGAWLVAFRRRYGWPDEQRSRNGSTLANRDYAWAAPRADRKTRRQGLPDRAGFGLPLPFSKTEIITWHERGSSRRGDPRRASPLHLHVAKTGDKYYPVLTYIPSRFLPGNGEVRFKNASSPSRTPTPEQLDIVERFLDDLEAKDLVERVTP